MTRNVHFGAAFCVLVAFMAMAKPANATTLSFAVPPASIGPQFQNTNVDLFSSSLNGTLLSGQAMSLDLDLAGDILARIGLLDPGQLGVNLTVFTNAATQPGFAGTTTGYLLNPSGVQLGDTLDAGRSQGSDGTFSMALVLFTPANLGNANSIDISGAHFNTTLPSSGFTVTDARLRFTLGPNSLQLGTPAQLPEASTLVLLLTGLCFSSAWSYRRVAAGR